MARRLLALLILVLVAGCITRNEHGWCQNVITPVRQAALSAESFVRSKHSTIILLRRAGPVDYSGVVCAGVAIDRRLVLTAAHCIPSAAMEPEDASQNDGEFDGTGFLVRVVRWADYAATPFGGKVPSKMAFVAAFDARKDLALLIADASDLHSTGVRFERPKFGESVYTIGHPAGVAYTLSTGHVTVDQHGILVQTDVPIWFGNSGGGLFDSHGRLVGICSAIGDAPNASLFVNLTTIRTFLAKVGIIPA